jgi:hypothetical protein
MVPNKHKQRYIEMLKNEMRETMKISDKEIEEKLVIFKLEERMKVVPDVIMHYHPSVWVKKMMSTN